MWIGYGGAGLGRLKDGRFSHCRMAQGLHDDYLSNMIPDGRGRLWFAGNQGIFSVRETEAVELAEGRIARVRSVAYGQTEGLSRLQASHGTWPGTLRANDGRLWFAMESGLAVVNVPDFKEALHNILQHSGANQAQLEIASDAQILAVTLSDHGRGFAAGPKPEGADGFTRPAPADVMYVVQASAVRQTSPLKFYREDQGTGSMAITGNSVTRRRVLP